MYDYIRGKFTYKTSDSKGFYVTVETCGVGYLFEITERDFEALPEESKDLTIYSVLLHREDKMSLCGFLKREERDVFNVLTSVSGVGSKMALTLLNSFNLADLIGFVIDGNYKELTKAKGVGPKLAQKIILELKDKLNSYKGQSSANKSSVSAFTQEYEDARGVLISLGYANEEVNSALIRTMDALPSKSSAEEILKKSLQLLSI